MSLNEPKEGTYVGQPCASASTGNANGAKGIGSFLSLLITALHFARSMGVGAADVLDEDGCATGVDSFDLTFSFNEGAAGGGAREPLGDGLAGVGVEEAAKCGFGGRETSR